MPNQSLQSPSASKKVTTNATTSANHNEQPASAVATPANKIVRTMASSATRSISTSSLPSNIKKNTDIQRHAASAMKTGLAASLQKNSNKKAKNEAHPQLILELPSIIVGKELSKLSLLKGICF